MSHSSLPAQPAGHRFKNKKGWKRICKYKTKIKKKYCFSIMAIEQIANWKIWNHVYERLYQKATMLFNNVAVTHSPYLIVVRMHYCNANKKLPFWGHSAIQHKPIAALKIHNTNSPKSHSYLVQHWEKSMLKGCYFVSLILRCLYVQFFNVSTLLI